MVKSSFKLCLPPIFLTDLYERPTVSGEMSSKRYSTLAEEQPEMDEGCGLFDARMQPVVKLYRIGM